jgi:hypothetical protein
MRIDDFLKQKKAAIKRRWLELIIDTYPADGREFFRKQKNRFLNPVGAALSRLVEALYDELLNGAASADISTILEDFVKVRAVQDFTPSEAVGFVLYLKQAVREELAEDIRTSRLFEELLALETRIDRLLLKAFDVYMQAREKIYEIKANDLKRKSFLALRRADSDPAKGEPEDDSHEHTPD